MQRANSWSSAEDELLIELIDKGLGYREIAEALDRSYSATRQHALKILKIQRKSRVGPYSVEEDHLVIEWCKSTDPYSDLALILGRTTGSVEGRVSQLRALGMITDRKPRPPDPKAWAPEEDAVLAELASTMSYAEIGEILGRTRWAVNHRAHILEIQGRSRSERLRGEQCHWYVDGRYQETRYWRGYDWQEARIPALERDGYSCQQPACKVFSPGERFIVVHHIIPWRLTQDNSLDNLVTLCRSHHGQRPEHSLLDYWFGMEDEPEFSFLRDFEDAI